MSRSGLLSVVLFVSAPGCGSTTQRFGATGSVSGPSDNVKRLGPAVLAADGVYQNPAFWALVAERKWISSANPARAIPGSDVAGSLEQIRPRAQTYTFKHFGWGYLPFFRGGTNASTAQCVLNQEQCAHIYINVKDDDDLSRLLNTVAHENTHDIGAAITDNTRCHCTNTEENAYLDTPDHPIAAEVWMVSYGIGDLAQCFATSNGDRAKTWACFGATVNGEKQDRAKIECVDASSIKSAVLAELRAAAAECHAGGGAATARSPNPRR